MIVYPDTSFIVSLYLPDRHSQDAERRLVRRPLLCMTPLHRAEWTHAIAQHVFRHEISASEAQQVYKAFERDRADGLWEETALSEAIFETCVELARRYAARLGVRTLDTLHVAAALELKAQEFWTYDGRQGKLAKAAGLKTS